LVPATGLEPGLPSVLLFLPILFILILGPAFSTSFGASSSSCYMSFLAS
jgi:hypothetical protein